MAGGRRFRFGDFTLDVAGRRLERSRPEEPAGRAGEEVPLQPKVFATLVHLVEHPGRVLTKDELLSALWPDTSVGEASLTRCIRQIRKALGDDARTPRYVKTEARVGFRFVAPVAPASATGSTGRAIAVLPFLPLTSSPRDESLELGVAETLIARLSGLRGLVVRSLGTVRRHAGPDRDPVELGRALGVDAVIEGSLQRDGDRLRVTVRALAVEDGRALLAEHFEEPLQDVFGVQDAICRRVVRALSVELSDEEASRLSARETRDPEAYRHFLRGRLALGRVTPGSAERSIPHFERALALDQRYAQARASLAEAWIVRATLGLDTAVCYAEARSAARAALEIDDRLGGAWACLATIAFQLDWDWDAADRLFERASALSPEVVDIWCSWSDAKAFTGRHEQAVALARRALEVDPASPKAGAWLAQALHMSERPEEALRAAGSTLAKAPGFPFALFFMGLSCLQLSRPAEAADWLEQAAGDRPDFAGVLGYAYVRAGREAEALRVETALEAAVSAGRAPSIALAPIHAARGDADRLFEALEHAFEQRGWHVLLLPSEPLLSPFRGDPRAVELIRRLALPEADATVHARGSARI